MKNKLKFINKNTETTVYHGNGYGPDFGDTNPALLINCKGKCLNGKKNSCCDSKGCFTFTNKNFIGFDVKGQYFFDVEDYEVNAIQI